MHPDNTHELHAEREQLHVDTERRAAAGKGWPEQHVARQLGCTCKWANRGHSIGFFDADCPIAHMHRRRDTVVFSPLAGGSGGVEPRTACNCSCHGRGHGQPPCGACWDH